MLPKVIIGIVIILGLGAVFFFHDRSPLTRQTVEQNASTSPTTSTADWDRYRETALDQIILEEKDFALIPEGKTDNVYQYNAIGVHNPYKVKLIYKNEYRKISSKRMEFLRDWATSLKAVTTNIEEYPKLFETETLLVNGDKEYWMPIQNQLIPHLKSEVKSNELVEVFIFFIGTYLESGEINWVFTVNEFKSQ